MSTSALVNDGTLSELGDVIGRDKLDSLVDRFVSVLVEAFPSDANGAEEIGREAHTLVSMAGMLGCDALCDACRALETEIKTGGDVGARLSAAQVLRDATVEALANRRAAS